MADLQYIPVGFKQTNDICLLASYSFVLRYYKNLHEGLHDDVNMPNVCGEYIDFITHNSNVSNCFSQLVRHEYQALYDQNGTIKDINCYEYFISRVLHIYCQRIMNDIRGYIHIQEFDEYLRKNDRQIHSKTFDICGIRAEKYIVHDAYSIVKNHLDNGNHNLAMIMYLTPRGGHSVVLLKNSQNGQYQFRDPNCDNISDTASILDAYFVDQRLDICEYILFSCN